jgi:hypothetical protein
MPPGIWRNAVCSKIQTAFEGAAISPVAAGFLQGYTDQAAQRENGCDFAVVR